MTKKEIWRKIIEILIYALSAFSGGMMSSCTTNVSMEQSACASVDSLKVSTPNSY